MKEINYRKIEEMPITIEVMNMISALHEYKGRQELYIETQPEILERLMEVARIQSTEASNKIEGIYTSDARLKEIVQKKSEPRNRNEKEIAGYREVLGMIHDSYSYIQLKPNDILTLHKYLYSYSESGNGGHYKMVDNYIEEEDKFGNKSVRFQPVPAVLTAEYIESLCKQYEDVINHTHIDPLLVIPCVILDFLCIHPFGDGNGRTGRMIMFKQCLQNSHIPFVLLDRDRAFYLRGLKEWDFERNYLIDTLLTQQDIYASVCEQLDFKKE